MGTIGERLRELRGDLTQQEMADIVGTTKQYVSQLEKGRNQTPNGAYLEGWARHFRVSHQWLVTGKGEKAFRSFISRGGETSQLARLDPDTVREVADSVREGLRDAYQDPSLELDLTRPDHAVHFVEGYMTAMQMEQQGRQSKAAMVIEISRQVRARGARQDGSGSASGDQGKDRSEGAGGVRRKAPARRRTSA